MMIAPDGEMMRFFVRLKILLQMSAYFTLMSSIVAS